MMQPHALVSNQLNQRHNTSESSCKLSPHSPTYLEYHPVQSLALSEPTLMCMPVGEAWQQQNSDPAVIVTVGGDVLAGAVGVNGSWGLWGEERHAGMQSDQDAAR